MIQLGYILRRIGVFVLVVWVAATLSFIMPRIAPVNPIRERLLQAVSYGGAAKTDMEKRRVALFETSVWKRMQDAKRGEDGS